MSWKKLSFILCLGAAIFAGASEFTVPSTAKAPVIDGCIHAEEWQNALLLSGAGYRLDPRRTQIYLTWDANYFYIAMRSETPPRGKPVLSKNSLGPVADDSLEMWFAPPEKSRNIEVGKFGEFQLIVNHIGEVYLMHHNPGYGLPAKRWNADIKTANSIHDGVWDLEIAIPAEAFGFQQLTAPADWKLLPVRNFRTQPEGQFPFTDVNGFQNANSYSVFKFRSNAPAVQNDYSLAFPRLPARLTISNPSGQPACFTINGQVNAEPFSETLNVQAGQNATIDLASKVPENTANIAFSVRDAAGQVIFNRAFQYAPPSVRIWFNPESFITLEQNFESGLDQLSYSTQGVKVALKNHVTIVPGRTENSNAAYLGKPGDGITYQGAKLSMPGALTMWVKSDGPAGKPYRRYFASDFRGSGYVGLQESDGSIIMFAHKFESGSKTLMIPKPISTGEWRHIAVNFYPNRFELYLNGIKCGEINMGFQINPSSLGDLVVGQSGCAGFALDKLIVFDRPLESAEIKVMAQGDSKIAGSISWYPALNSLVLDISCNLDQLKSHTLELDVADSKNVSQFKTTLQLDQGYALQESGKHLQIIHLQIPLKSALPDGQYLASLKLPGSVDPMLEKPFQVKQYKWVNNQLGIREMLLPPFTPVKVNDSTISCILRDYQLAPNGLPAQITALQKPILAAPVSLITEKNGQTEAIPDGKLSFTRKSDTAVEFTAESFGKLLKMQVNGHFEFDGLLKLDLILNQLSDTPPDRVYLDIPVRKESALLFHAVGDSIRVNPAGFLPSGQGIIWKSRSIPQNSISNFIPYIWVGDDERGIAYAADWDRGWIHTGHRDAVELFRHENGDVSIRLNLLNAPIKLKKDHQITLVLMASPVKPMPQGWRGWSDGFGFNGTRIARALYSNPYWGSYYGWTARYPAFEDFTYIKKLVETKNTGVIDQEFVKSWLDRLNKASPAEAPWIKKFGQSFAVRHTNSAFSVMQMLYPVRDKAVIYPYTCNCSIASTLPEFPVFQDEWSPLVHVYKSYADYAIYYLNQMLEYGFNGVYNDNTFFAANYNWVTGNAYIDDQGTVRPSFGLWRIRDYHKRQLTLMVERGLDPWITVHNTNANILPTLCFATNTMGMEWKYGSQDFQERFTPDYIRTVNQGRQGGFFPTVIDGVFEKDPVKRTWVTRTMLAVLLPHEVRPTCPHESDAQLYRKIYDLMYRFGIAEPDCSFRAYWDESALIRSDDPKLLVSTYQRGKKLLLVCGSYTGNITARLTIRGTTFKSAKNAETGTTLAIDGNTVTFPMKKHDFALIEAELN